MASNKKTTTTKRKSTASKKTTSNKAKVNSAKKTTSNKTKATSIKKASSSKVNNKSTKKINSKDIKKDNKRNLIFNILIVILSIIVVVSFVLLIQKRKEEEKTIIEINESKLVKPASDIEVPKKTVEEEISDLKKKYNNNDVIGILNIDNEIYTPVVQTKDNQYYLKYSLSKKRSAIGSTFMDYRVSKDSKQINIYGHNHSNKKYNPPFKTLEGYLKKEYFDEHRIIELKIDNETLKYEIFSIVLADKVGTEEHMKLKYKKDSDWLKHFNRLKNRSIYKTDVELNQDDKIIVLQTCLFGKHQGKLMVVVGRKID